MQPTTKEQYKDLWIEALRSGRYKQGQRCLRKQDRFCCLGVLCDLINPTGWVMGKEGGRYKMYGIGRVLHVEIAKQVGLSHEGEQTLAGMNDSGFSFAEIADYIEANWQYLHTSHAK